MFAMQTCLMEEQVTQSVELQRLLGIRVQKLQELLQVEHQIRQVATNYQAVATQPAVHQPNPSTIVREEESEVEEDITDDDVKEKPQSKTFASYADVVDKTSRRGRPPKTEGLAQDKSLSNLITTFLAGKRNGEKLAAITVFCLQAGYESSAKDFSQVVRQTLYNLRAKKVVTENKQTKRFIIN